MCLEIGNKVAVIDADIKGVVTKIKNEEILLKMRRNGVLFS